MRRPVGVSALAVIFDAVAAFFSYCGVGAIFTADHIKGLFFLVVAFMSAALGIGLWDFAEDARRAAIAFFLIPSTFGIVVGLISAFQESPPPPSGDVVPAQCYFRDLHSFASNHTN